MTRLLLPYAIIDSPPATPPLYGLRDSARDITPRDEKTLERALGGVTFVPETCASVTTWSIYCPTGGGPVSDDHEFDEPDEDIDAAGLGPREAFPFGMYVPIWCDLPGALTDDLRAKAIRQLEAGTSKALEAQFWSNELEVGLGDDVEGNTQFWLTDTPNVQASPYEGESGILNASAETTPTAVSPVTALAMMSMALGNCGLGGRGMIHVTPWVATLWEGSGLLEKDGKRLVTKARGDIVVVGGGYPGTGPTGNASAAASYTRQWIYGTGMVEYVLSDPEIPADDVQSMNRLQNYMTYYAQRQAVIAVDPCCSFAALVDLSDPTSESA